MSVKAASDKKHNRRYGLEVLSLVRVKKHGFCPEGANRYSLAILEGPELAVPV